MLNNLGRNTLLNIRNVKISGDGDHAWLMNFNHDYIWDKFKEHGIKLPDIDTIKKLTDCRILYNELSISFQVYNKSEIVQDYWEFKFLPGFIWDMASVPKILRGIVDNDSYELRLPAMVHDVLYGLHLTKRREADQIFYALSKELYGKGKSSILAYLGVRLGGHIPYKKNDPNTHWFNGFVKVKRNGSILA